MGKVTHGSNGWFIDCTKNANTLDSFGIARKPLEFDRIQPFPTLSGFPHHQQCPEYQVVDCKKDLYQQYMGTIHDETKWTSEMPSLGVRDVPSPWQLCESLVLHGRVRFSHCLDPRKNCSQSQTSQLPILRCSETFCNLTQLYILYILHS